MIAWGRMFNSAMHGISTSGETGLVRMFRIEYAKDYKHMKSMGYEINDSTVKAFLRARN